MLASNSKVLDLSVLQETLPTDGTDDTDISAAKERRERKEAGARYCV